MSFCPRCGRGVAAGAQFCASCGASLQAPDAPTYAPPPATYGAPPHAPNMIVARVRPTGVAILAVLQFIGAGFLALAGLVFTFGGTAFAAAMASGGNEFSDFWGGAIGTFFIVVGIVCLLGAALGIFLGRGLWTGRPWARILSLVFAWLGLVSGALGVVGSLTEDASAVVIQIVLTALYGFLVWYWTRPGVRSFFESSAPIQ